MKYDVNRSITGVSNTRFSAFTFFKLCLFLLVALLLCLVCLAFLQDDSPPDLSSCTRIEVRYPSVLDYFFPDSDMQDGMLSPSEKEYLESFEFFTVNDQERIKAFAHDVSLGEDGGSLWLGPFIFKVIDAGTPVKVDCYRDNEHIASFTLFYDCIVTNDDRLFDYPEGLPNSEMIEPPEIRPFKLRFLCGLNIRMIYAMGPMFRMKDSSYPDPNEWCDAFMRDRINKSYVSQEEMRGRFKCPAAGEGEYHYAMNSYCKPDSPPGTVLLFETNDGWNQHGGPELFTFDNHEPKGGWVLLNNWTVKFIHTKEELQQLRWK